MNIQRLFILTLIGLTLTILFSGCLISIYPTPVGAPKAGVVITSPVGTNVLAQSSISAIAVKIGTLLENPAAGAAAATVIGGLIYVWRLIRSKRAASKRGLEIASTTKGNSNGGAPLSV